MSGQGQWDIATSVGLTALGAAAGRAIESHRRDGLIDDPLAEAFVAAAAPASPLPTRPEQVTDDPVLWRLLSLHMAARVRYYDEVAVAGPPQVVVLAAGLDTRAFRLAWPPGSVVFELDQPRVLAFKRDVAAAAGAVARCERREVPADLRDDWPAALEAAGFDPRRPTTWLTEGLLPYLPDEAAESMLAAVTARSAPGSRLGLEDFSDVTDRAVLDGGRRIAAAVGVDVEGLMHAQVRHDRAARLRELGWTVDVDRLADVATAWGRPELTATDDGFRWPDVDFMVARR